MWPEFDSRRSDRTILIDMQLMARFKNTPNIFLRFSGVLLVIFGFVGNGEFSAVRAALGAVMIIASLTIPARDQRTLALVVGTAMALYTALMAAYAPHIDLPISLPHYILNIVVAVWGLVAGARRTPILAGKTPARA